MPSHPGHRYRWGVPDIPFEPIGIDEVRQISRCRLGHGDQRPQHGEFELQLDAVDERLERLVRHPPVQVDEDDEGDVHDDDGNVHGDQPVQLLSTGLCGHKGQQAGREIQVQPREDELLHRESGQLDLLHDVKGADELGSGWIGDDRAEPGDDVGNMEEDGADDNHGQHESQPQSVM